MRIIIKPGNLNKIKTIKFECKECGCIFEATKIECTIIYCGGYNEERYECKCPTCNNSVFSL